MDLAFIAVEKIAEMFLIILVGVMAFRWKIIDSNANKKLSGILLKIVTPAIIFMAYQIDYQPERLKGLIITFFISLASFVWVILLAKALIRPGKGGDMAIERFSAIYSNAGFMGIPLVNGILGTEGVFYLTAYITAFNLIVWSHGLSLMCGIMDGKGVLKNFFQPATIAIGLGIVCFLFRVRLPDMVVNPIKMMGDMNTALAMLIAGCNLAESNLLGAMKKGRTYGVCFMKLILIPLASVLLLSWIPVERIYRLTVLVAISCPTAAMGTMFALQYNKDSNYASELFTVSTLLSLLTIPFAVLLGGWLL